jgi:FKBP-type peptidyl-prolyl cis-trans isomerase
MRITVLALLIAAIGLVSCKKDYQTTKSGLKYKFFEQNDKGKKPKDGDIIRIHLVSKAQGDSVLMSTYKRGEPLEVRVTKPEHTYDLMEGFMMMSEGDSVSFQIPTDSVMNMNIPGIKPGGIMDFTIKMVKVMTQEDYQKELTKAHDERVKSQKPLLDKYIADKGLTNVQETATGLRYVVTTPGTGPMPAQGSVVKVHYKGYFFDGKVFDESFSRNEPYELMLGAGQVIPGWDEGLSYFPKGGKGMLIIPSYLAYGERGNVGIPPNTPLVFDIEMVDVKNEPVAPQNNMPMPQQK